MDELFKLIGLGTPFLYAGGTYAFFRWLDTNTSDEARAALSRLVKLRTVDGVKLSSAILQAFDTVYTFPLLSWRAFIRSSLITITFTGLYILYFVYSGLPSGRYLDLPSEPTWFVQMIKLFGASWTVNLLTDYVSLFIVRRWLIVAGGRPIIALILCSMIGVFITAASIVLRFPFLLPFLLYSPREGFSNFTLQFFLSNLLQPAMLELLALPPALLVFAWLPLFGLGLAMVRLINVLQPVVLKMQWFLKDGKDHPLIAVGYVAGAIVFVIAVAWRLLLPAPGPADTPQQGALGVLAMPVSEEFVGLSYAPEIPLGGASLSRLRGGRSR
jgi:hypothetical protein